MMKYFQGLLIVAAFFLSPLAKAQNGFDRGGGDPIAAEVFNLAREVAKKISTWTKNGTIQLNTEQVEKIQTLVNCTYSPKVTSDTCLLVISLEKVYRFPELAPSVDAIEVTMANIANHKPPMIEVSRSLWPTLQGKPLEKEMMVLHELIGASSTNLRVDDQFFKSYELKTKTLEAWAKHKDLLIQELITLYQINKNALRLDLTNLKTFAETLEITSPEMFEKIDHPEKFAKKKKQQNDIQIDAYNQFVEIVTKGTHYSFVSKNTKANNDYYKALFNSSLQSYADKIAAQPIDWYNWSVDRLKDYVDHFENITMKSRTTFTESFGTRYLREHCPNPYTGAMDELTHCMMDAMKTGLQTEMLTIAEDWQKELNQSLEEVMLKVNLTISPDEI